MVHAPERGRSVSRGQGRPRRVDVLTADSLRGAADSADAEDLLAVRDHVTRDCSPKQGPESQKSSSASALLCNSATGWFRPACMRTTRLFGLLLVSCVLTVVGCAATPAAEPTSPPGPSAVASSSAPTSTGAPASSAGSVLSSDDPTPSGGGSIHSAASSAVGPSPSDPATGRQEPVWAELAGRSFRMVGTVTDAGGADLMTPGLDLTIAFGEGMATISGDCSLTYKLATSERTGSSDPRIDFGEPSGPTCRVGQDPTGPPFGVLWIDEDHGRLSLSTGVVGWLFDEVG